MLALKRVPVFILYLVFMLPIALAYIVIFILSMNTALDRVNYLRIMDTDIETRVEPLLPIIAYLLDYIITNSVIKLISIQLFFIYLLLLSLYIYFRPKELVSLSKCFIALLLCLAVFSNPLGIQLRMGYATIIFIYLIVRFRKPTLFLLIPIAMHYGAIASVLIFLYIHIFKINSTLSFTKHSILIIIFCTVLFTNIELVFDYLGVKNYYYSYLSEELVFGRAFPYSVIMYILVCSYIIFFINKKDSNFYWFSLSGLWLLYIGFVLDFYLAFKMLVPISIFALFYAINNFPKIKQPYTYLFLAYLLMPIVLYYFALKVDYI